MFDEKKALKLLEDDCKEYIRKTIAFAQGFLDRNMVEAAVTTIVTAGDELKRLDGAMQYVEQLASFNLKEDYPRFGTIFGGD